MISDSLRTGIIYWYLNDQVETIDSSDLPYSRKIMQSLFTHLDVAPESDYVVHLKNKITKVAFADESEAMEPSAKRAKIESTAENERLVGAEQEQQSVSLFERLPKEIRAMIISYLDARALARMASVSTKYRKLAAYALASNGNFFKKFMKFVGRANRQPDTILNFLELLKDGQIPYESSATFPLKFDNLLFCLFLAVHKKFPNITFALDTVSWGQNSNFSEKRFGDMIAACPAKRIDLSHCFAIRGEVIADHMPAGVEELNLYNTTIVESNLATILDRCRNIKVLRFNLTETLPARAVTAAFSLEQRGCKSFGLEKIGISAFDDSYTIGMISAVVKSCPALKAMSLHGFKNNMASLPLPANLQKLTVAGLEDADTIIDKALEKVPQLEKLTIKCCMGLTKHGIASALPATLKILKLKSNTALSGYGELKLNRQNFTDIFAKSPQLQSIFMGCPVGKNQIAFKQGSEIKILT